MIEKKHKLFNSSLAGRLNVAIRLALLVTALGLLQGCALLFDSGERDGHGKQCRSELEALRDRYAHEPRATNYMPAQPVQKLPEPNLDVTPEVKHHIRAYGGGPNARFIQGALALREPFYPLLAEIFADEGIPETMLNLALIESGFRANAKSPVGAVGLWQFMTSTARVYGLKVGLLVDERKDPILSTIAAARLLKDLYRQYGDWHLALAAYNAGTGGLDRALSKSGERSFWRLARSGKLNRQTAEFVPKFIAASLLINSAVAERELRSEDKRYALLQTLKR
jgi:hypothetical protein